MSIDTGLVFGIVARSVLVNWVSCCLLPLTIKIKKHMFKHRLTHMNSKGN